MNISKGDKVIVQVLGRGPNKLVTTRECTVVEVVKAGRKPKKAGYFGQVATRKHESYVVEDAAGVRYWPLVNRISVGTLPAPQVLPPTPAAEIPGELHPVLENLERIHANKDGAPSAPTPAPVEPITDYIFVVDESGSMQGLVSEMNKLFEQQIETLRKTAVGQVFVTVWSVGHRGHSTYLDPNNAHQQYKLRAARTPLGDFKPMMLGAYGGTPLFECVHAAVEDATKRPAGENHAYVLNVMTDGEDEHTRRQMFEVAYAALKASMATDRWTHAFMLPRGAKAKFLARFWQIPAGNVTEWDTTSEGIKAAATAQTTATANYMRSRSAGYTKSSNYFQPDLSKVTDADLAKLTDVSASFKIYEALKESDVETLVKERAPRYVVGSAYYQLTKKTEISGNKAILVRHRKTGRIYGGLEARKLVGLELNVDAKVEPGNHGDFEIYAQTHSPNRIVPRGAKMAHDITQTVDQAPTWDRDAALAEAAAKRAANGTPAPTAVSK